MKLLIAGLAAGLLSTVAPAWADDDRRDGWRGHTTQQVWHWDNRWDRHRYSHRHHPRAPQRHWHRYDDRRYYYAPPRQRHYQRDYRYGYYAPEPSPSVWFSWTIR